ncbi:MAG TPA: Lsr2 family protein [Pseudonocardiaceae bacterium]|nr:Lsr2 family protein [Pseudonocardiaceae bacterium]
MARKVLVRLVDDLDGKPSEDVSTVTFALDRVEYQIDLSEANASQLREKLAGYVASARRTGGRLKRGSAARTAETRSSDASAVREWARSQGHDLADRGRIPAHIVEAYEAAKSGRGATKQARGRAAAATSAPRRAAARTAPKSAPKSAAKAAPKTAAKSAAKAAPRATAKAAVKPAARTTRSAGAAKTTAAKSTGRAAAAKSTAKAAPKAAAKSTGKAAAKSTAKPKAATRRSTKSR